MRGARRILLQVSGWRVSALPPMRSALHCGASGAWCLMIKASKLTMAPRALKDGSAWYIELTWPDGRAEQIDGFQSEAEIGDWIARKSEAWLKARSA